MKNRTRLEKLEERHSEPARLKVFYYDYDNVNLYDAPCGSPGACLVEPGEVERLEEEGFVIIVVRYGDGEPGEDELMVDVD